MLRQPWARVDRCGHDSFGPISGTGTAPNEASDEPDAAALLEKEQEERAKKRLAGLEQDVRRQEEEWASFRAALPESEKKQLTVEKEHLLEELKSTADEIQ